MARWHIKLDKELVVAAKIIYSEVCDLIDNTSETELNDEAKTTKKISDIIMDNTAYVVREYSLKKKDIENIYNFFDTITTHTKLTEDGSTSLLEGSVISGICFQNGFSGKNINQPDVCFRGAAELSKQRITNLYITSRHNNFRLFIIPAVLSSIAIAVSILSVILGVLLK